MALLSSLMTGFGALIGSPRPSRARLVSRLLATRADVRASMARLEPYTPPIWAESLSPVPTMRVSLGQFPTPIHRWKPPGLEGVGVEMWVKRDDWSGMELGGNKVRKLEFLLAEAVSKNHDSVITIGGIQSNHARATAMGARLLGLEAHLILRTTKGLEDKDPGLVGNLLPERLAGAYVNLVTKSEYASHGSAKLLGIVEERLRSEGKNPYVIPVGGSNALGTWGYVEFVKELTTQMKESKLDFDEVILATGSGGTATGIALGLHLSGSSSKTRSFAVCDDEEYFHHMADVISEGMGVKLGEKGYPAAQNLLTIHQAKGRGYAISSEDELRMMARVAKETGLILDPVYSGKALYGFLKIIKEHPSYWAGRRVLFVHTGGMLGMYDKAETLGQLLSEDGEGRFKHLFAI
ncbi:hypothetical protein AAMO2058_000713300 [Amorphochlora amoebiformis]